MAVGTALPMGNPAIVANGLTKSFGEGEARVTAVKGVAFSAKFGEMLFIVGPSGSGKTTLLSMISGILRPTSGTVSVNGADIWTQSSYRLADFRLHTIGFVFQDYHLFPRLTTITYWNLALAFRTVLLIAAVSGYIGVRKVLRIEPFGIFRR